MAKSRSIPTSTRPFVRYLGSGNGNGHGSPPLETDDERLARIEGVLTRMQTVLETQFLPPNETVSAALRARDRQLAITVSVKDVA